MPEREMTLKIPFFERRRRIRRPLTLVIFGLAFLVLPLFNYLGMTNQLGLPLAQVRASFSLLSSIEIALLLIPLAVGLGLLLVKRWGWWLFLAYACVLILYNLYALIRTPGFYNGLALVNTVVGMVAVFYFLRRDVSAPYMRMHPRGWRLQKRRPIEFEVIVDGIRRRTIDASLAGLYISWEDCYRSPGEEVHLTFVLDGNEYKTRAGLVRVDEEGAGVAFRATSRSFRSNLKRDLASMETA